MYEVNNSEYPYAAVYAFEAVSGTYGALGSQQINTFIFFSI